MIHSDDLRRRAVLKVRERRTETDRQTDRQTERQTQRETILVFVYALRALGRARACEFMNNVSCATERRAN